MHRDITDLVPRCLSVLVNYTSSDTGGTEIVKMSQKVQPTKFQPQFPWSGTSNVLKNFSKVTVLPKAGQVVIFDSRLLHRPLGHFEESIKCNLFFLLSVNNGPTPSNPVDGLH